MGFLERYNDELTALRRRAGAFAAKHPKIAGRLRMTPDTVDDPHVERMLQGFAYSAARVRQKLEDDFPELTDTLLEALYPQYLAPIPSMSVVAFEPSTTLDEMARLPRGFEVQTEMVRGDRCAYRTTLDIDLAPVRVAGCALERPPFRAPPAPHLNARSCFSLSLEPTGGVGFGEMDGWEPTLFLRGPVPDAARLYELLLNRTLGVAVAPHADADPAEVTWLPPSAIEAVGFAEDEAALPFPPRSFPGFRLLTEFFALPEKFLFVRLRVGDALARVRDGRASVYVYGDANPEPMLRSVNAEAVALHCAPVMNLFAQHAEPIHVDRTRHEYDIVPDARHHATREVHSVRRVTLSRGNGSVEVSPFFGQRVASPERRAGVHWQHKRVVEEDGVATSRLALVDLTLNAATPDTEGVASVETLCLHRTLPELLPFGGGQPYLSVRGNAERIARATMLLAPTPTTRFDRGEGATWRLLAHLSLNHLALTSGDPELLRDMLRLYDYRGARETGALIESLASVTSERATARLPDGSVVGGVDVAVTFDGSVDRGQAFLIGQVLSRFLGLYASINTFSRLTVYLAGIALPVARFEPRTAAEPLL